MDAAQRNHRGPSKDAASASPAPAAATPLSGVADAFEKLAGSLSGDRWRNGGGGIRLDALCDACGPVSVLFGCLGMAFKFAELEFVSKVCDLMEASKKYGTLEKIIDFDVANCTVKKQGSHTRNLRRVRLGLDLIRALFEQFLSSHDNSLKEAATTAYSQVCAPYHSWAVRTAVYTGMYALPSRDQLLLKLKENDHSAEKKMRRYINACIPVIEYIDKLYLCRNITLDW
ncbi:ACD11 homolog protein-like [Syzygium oleosum]|uniref:ACD11 homolog protein-like n=1 Tax=Syzygium oleosum TaxID=219896 RepID=UPI0011D26514|nr:ACD11 homolog protein-like [Syzygium oleosum]